MTHPKDRKHRGEGSKDTYDPYYHIQDRTTRKSSVRIPSLDGGRLVHVLGKEETAAYYVYCWSSAMVDINEQYPLQTLETTLAIAHDCGIHHPTQHGKPRMLAFTFRLVYRDHGEEKCAFRTVVRRSAIKSMLAELEIHRQYALQGELDWGIITELNIPTPLARNIEYLYGYRHLDKFPLDFQTRCTEIKDTLLTLAAPGDQTIEQLAANASAELALPKGQLINFCQHLLFNKDLMTTMDEPITAYRSLIYPRSRD